MTGTAEPFTTSPTVTVPTRVHHERPVRAGQELALRVSIAHPMVSSHQLDPQGRRQARRILTRFECHGPDGLIFATRLHPGVAANPSLAFWIRPTAPGPLPLRLRWWGDEDFRVERLHVLEVVA